VRFGDAAVLVDHVGDAFCVLVAGRIRGAVRDADLSFGVAEEWEGKVELLSEAGIRADTVETRTEDRRVLCFVLVDEVPEPGTLGRSARGVGLRIKPEHDLASTQVVQRNRVPAMIRHFKIRSLVTNLQHASSSQRLQGKK
jgi:hypothetical protein